MPLDTRKKELDFNGRSCDLEAFAEAVQVLEHAKEVAAGRCMQLLTLPIDGVLDVVKVWRPTALKFQTNGKDHEELGDILRALKALDGKIEAALLLLHKLVAPMRSDSKENAAATQLQTQVAELGSLLENLARSIKHIVAQAQSSIGAPHTEIVSLIQSAVIDFAAVNRLCIEEVNTYWDTCEMEIDRILGQRLSPSSPTTGHAANTSIPEESLALSIPSSGGPESQDEVGIGGELGQDAYQHHDIRSTVNPCDSIDNLDQALALCNQEHYILPDVLFDATNTLYNWFKMLGQQFRSRLLSRRAIELQIHFGQSGQIADLEQAITYFRDALTLSQPGHPDRATDLDNLASALFTRFNHTGQMGDLEQAIAYYRVALELCPPGHPDRHFSLDNLAVALVTRFGHSGEMEDLEQAIAYHHGALELRPPEHPYRHFSLDRLANALSTRFDQSGQIADLERAIAYHHDALALRPHGHRGRSKSLNDLAAALYARFRHSNQMADLELAIAYHRGALELCPPGHPDRHISLSNLALAMRSRFGESGQMSDLEQAITYHHDTLDLRPPEHPERSAALNSFATTLWIRFGQLGQMVDLEQAIIYYQDALVLRPPGHPDRSSTLNELVLALSTRFNQSGQEADLDQAITYHGSALELCPLGHPDLHISLGNLAAALFTRYVRSGQMADLELAITYYCHALELRPLEHPDRHSCLNNLALALRTRFAQSGKMADLEQSISYHDSALELRPPGHPDRHVSLDNLATALSTRFCQLGRMPDLEKAIAYYRDALELRPTGHSARYLSLNNLALALRTRFDRLGEMPNLEQAITYHRSALVLCPPGHPSRHSCLGNLALALHTRFCQLGEMSDLEQAVGYQCGALELCPPGHSERHFHLGNLALALRTRFSQLGEMVDLEQAIIYQQDALALRPRGHPDHPSTLNNLAAALRTRFNQLGQTADLERAISHHRSALELCSPGHLNLHFYHNDLALALCARFSLWGTMADLEEAIDHYRSALELCPLGHPDRHLPLDNLALAFNTRFNQSGIIADLEQAIVYHRSALELRPPGHPNRHSCLNNLALALGTRFGQSGQMVDLEQAITYHRSALALRSSGHPKRSTTLNNLAATLRTRFNQLGQMADLEQAITFHHEALDLSPPGQPERSAALNNLATALWTRFDQSGQMVDLEKAITYCHIALEQCPPGHPGRSKSLTNLAVALGTRFNHSGQMTDLEQTIAYRYDALDLSPPGHADRLTTLNNLADGLMTRFLRLNQKVDLEQSITYLRAAMKLSPPGHPERSTVINHLAHALEIRFAKFNSVGDLDEAVELLRSAANDTFDTPAHRYTCAASLITFLEGRNHPLLLEVYDLALGLLQMALAVYPDIELRHDALGTNRLSPSLAMAAAAHAIEQDQPEKAVEMLEQGRAMLWSSMRGYRQPVEGVRLVNAGLAARFKATSEQLETLAISSQSMSSQLLSQDSNESLRVSEARWARQRQLSLERNEIVQQIRKLDGFEHFLQAVPFNVLQNVAKEGPVIVVNVAPQRSDTIIIHQHGAPIILPLAVDGQNRKEAYNVILELSKLLFKEWENPGFSELLENVILKQLADLLVSPILEKLEALGVREQSRIWWCPTSALCALPIHAAGQLPNRYISSYTPTLSALISARTLDDQRHPASLDTSNTKPSLLAIIHPGRPPAQGERDRRLQTVFAECNVIKKAGGAGRVLAMAKTNATRQAALGQLPNRLWMHFACHGLLDISQPFRSAFELEDDPLSLSDLIQARLPNADFAFLAACDSATSGGISSTPDESLHLAAAVQFCGVRSVVGTLWPMADGDGPRVAQVFYRHMFKENDSRKSAEALYKAVTLMRRKAGPWAKAKDEGENLQRWANYIHIDNKSSRWIGVRVVLRVVLIEVAGSLSILGKVDGELAADAARGANDEGHLFSGQCDRGLGGSSVQCKASSRMRWGKRDSWRNDRPPMAEARRFPGRHVPNVGVGSLKQLAAVINSFFKFGPDMRLGLAILGIVVTAVSHQLRHSRGPTRSNGQLEDPSGIQTGLPLGPENRGAESSTRRRSGVEAFAEAIQTLEQTKEVVAGRCVQLLASPVVALLDVAGSRGVGEPSGILKALRALDSKMDSALGLLPELVASIHSNPEETLAVENLRGDIVMIGSLLGNLSTGTKHILAQTRSSIGTSRDDIVGSIPPAVQDFAALKRLCTEDVITFCAAYEESLAPFTQRTGGAASQEEAAVENEPGMDVYRRHRVDGSTDDLREGLALRNQEDHVLAGILSDAANSTQLAVASLDYFHALGQIEDLEQAIIHFHYALALCPPMRPEYPTILNNLAHTLHIRFKQLGQMPDLEQAIAYHRGALWLRPPGHPDRRYSLTNLALTLITRFKKLGQLADLEEAITYQRGALELSPLGHPERTVALTNLADTLRTRFEWLGHMADLEQALTHYGGALELSPPRHPDCSKALHNLAAALVIRFGQLGEMEDLANAITYQRGALELCPPGDPDRYPRLTNLAHALSTRFGQSGQLADLEEAIACQRGALKLCPPGHPDYYVCLNNLAAALYTCFEQSGQMTDLEQSITYHRSALELSPPGHLGRAGVLSNLAEALHTRFGQLGQMEDLEDAITYQCDALELCPPGDPNRHFPLNNLARALSTRFSQSGQMADLERAIIYLHDTLELSPSGHPGYPTALGNLALALITRFEKSGKIVDLENAIIHHHSTLELRPPGHPDRYFSLNNLAGALHIRFEKLGQMADLEEAITCYGDALKLSPPGHPGRSRALNNIALALIDRFGKFGQMEDLEKAITHQHGALELRPPGHPDRYSSLNSLADALSIRFMKSNHTEDLNEAIQLLRSGANDASDTPAHRYTCATNLLALLEAYNQPRLLEVYEMALGLLQLALAVYPDVESRRDALGNNRISPSLAMAAAAHAIEQGQPDKALEMLEQGRAMLWSSMRGYRQPVEGVHQVNAALADRFRATSQQLETLATSSQLGSRQFSGQQSFESEKISEARWAQQRQLSLERDEVIKQIRQLDGFEHFLQAVPFSVLQDVAKEGPVIVVNVSPQRSDAIIILQHGAPIILPLAVDGQNRKEAYSVILDLSQLLFRERGKAGFSKLLENTILKKLADILVSPVLEKFKSLGVLEQSRIWWCPTSALCALPIHAAGELPGRYISSYTPTLSALINARTFDVQQPPTTLNGGSRKLSLLAIIHPGHPPTTIDEPDGRLKMVFAECHVIEKAGGATRVLTMVKADATRQAVLGQLPNHPWAHFACHGRLNTTKPFQSAFEVEDDPLSLSDLVQARLPNAEFAFLAACDSATSGGTSGTPDESLHLAAAMQFCGVRSVVGTLWPMADEDGPRVAQVFYRHMFKENNSRKSAEALHKVVTAMRRKTGPWAKAKDEGEDLQRWANYIHIGA
ncbi:hypothetical protein HWV62_19677 [Athelia sp. TMB]|nr:hypothetical protein HWV62_19677 [Athelia sp. TMB]